MSMRFTSTPIAIPADPAMIPAMWRHPPVFILAALLLPGRAAAHASEQGFVLLLPTDLYIAGGVASVAATVLLIALIPAHAARGLFRPVTLPVPLRRPRLPLAGALSLAVFAWAIHDGLTGSQDPTRNAMPLTLWTALWLFVLTAQGIFGDLWRGLSPWALPLALLRRARWRAPLHLPRRTGRWPAVAAFIAFAAFLLVDPAPAQPDRLARIAAAWWLLHLAGLVLFGPRWLLRAEPLTALMRLYAGLAIPARHRGRLALGLPGWRLAGAAPPMALAVLALLALGVGSFDGLNETFWWFARIGMNPLEFTGRSAVIGESLIGLVAASALLITAFAATIHAGLILVEAPPGRFATAFRALAPAILPIAFAYHLAHYLPTALVEGQYLALRLNDPFRTGADLLGLSGYRVTTGFFNTRDTVEAIWLAQAGAVVIGHILGILMSHHAALRLFGTHRRAALSQAPLALFMILYTLFGLWLLASPRGA